MASPLIGQGIALATKLIPNFRTWYLENLDSGQTLQGQFSPQATTENVTVNWAQQTALNRGNAILQFVNENNDTLSFQGRFFRDGVTDADPKAKLDQLKSWARINSNVRRPPVLQFYVGDGHVQMNVVITGITNIVYGRPDALGGLRDVSFQVGLLQFEPFSLDDEGSTDTRYARAKDREYYELLAYEEYGNPLLGDYIRKLHPDQATLQDGDVVRLPSIEGVRNQRITQTSIPLQTGFGRRDTPQRSLRLFWFEKRSDPKVSHVFQE